LAAGFFAAAFFVAMDFFLFQVEMESPHRFAGNQYIHRTGLHTSPEHCTGSVTRIRLARPTLLRDFPITRSTIRCKVN